MSAMFLYCLLVQYIIALGDKFMDIGKRIKNIRKGKNMQANVLAKKAFISQSYLSDIENGRTTPSLDKLTTICDALGITLAEFFGYESELTPDLTFDIWNYIWIFLKLVGLYSLTNLFYQLQIKCFYRTKFYSTKQYFDYF